MLTFTICDVDILAQGNRKRMKLTEWLSKTKMSQIDLAKFLNVDRTLIFKWRKGIRRIGPKTLKALSQLSMGAVTQVDEVLDEKEER